MKIYFQGRKKMTKSKDNSDRENIFKIFDGMMLDLSKTKNIFLILIITTLIIPPIAILVATSAFDSPFHDRFKEDLEERLQISLQKGDLDPDQYAHIKQIMLENGHKGHMLKGPQLIIFALSLVWLAVGIRQWAVLSKWDKKYKKFKRDQEDVDKELADDSNDDDT